MQFAEHDFTGEFIDGIAAIDSGWIND